MTPERLAVIKKHAEDAKCVPCGSKQTISLAAAQAFIYEDAPELFKYVQELEDLTSALRESEPTQTYNDAISKTGL